MYVQMENKVSPHYMCVPYLHIARMKYESEKWVIIFSSDAHNLNFKAELANLENSHILYGKPGAWLIKKTYVHRGN